MAKKPQKPHRRSAGEVLLETFFGTFRRAMVTFGILFAIFAMMFPDTAKYALSNAIGVLVEAVGPVVPTLAAFAIVLWAIWIIVKKPPHAIWRGVFIKKTAGIVPAVFFQVRAARLELATIPV